MPAYKLHYFDAEGSTELARLILTEAGQKFEDLRHSREEWAKMKAENVFPWSQMPVLEVDGKQLPQSLSIARYLANLYGLAGNNAWDKAVIDSYVDVMTEVMMAMIKIYFGKDDAEKEEAKKTHKELACKKLEVFEKVLEANKKNGFLVGSKLSWADIRFMIMFGSMEKQDATFLDKVPNCKALVKKVAERPNIKKWIENRK